MGGNSSRVRVTGPLVPYADGFVADLELQGYRRYPVCDQLRLLAYVSRWLQGRSLAPSELTDERVGELLALRRATGYVQWNSLKGVTPLLEYLRRLEVVPRRTVNPLTPLEESVSDFRCYLVQERGLCSGTATSYVAIARLFLEEHLDLLEGRLGELTTRDVLMFVSEQCASRNPAYVVCGLRSFLRYAHLRGLMGPLHSAIPSVASRRLASLPAVLGAQEIRALLTSCDCTSVLGARDFAVLTLLTRLGLRAGEVAALELSDVDWRRGELRIRGKGSRIDVLPLPVDVGEALANWVRVRERCAVTNVFTRWRAPRLALSSSGVSCVVAAACRRAGLNPVFAHRLRHAAATELLRAGSSLPEIAQVLRHHNLLTTAIYAKVDLATLSSVAQPWPAS